MSATATPDHPHAARQRWMSVLARADGKRLSDLLQGHAGLPDHTRIRGPEIGLVMVRGRTGGDGAAFNLGEMTVTRCTVRLSDGTIGHAYVAGRDDRQAELAALIDALMQTRDHQLALSARVIETLAAEQQAARDATAGKAAATKVQFFAMQTMRT